jgi:predicted pyridoxine 5'-phosphate oxidase superfamily flavin-nucleotide-binding protein
MNKTVTPFHEGELAIQAYAGVSEEAWQTGRMIRDQLFAAAQPFIECQKLLLCASIDHQGAVWASILQGLPGFVRVIDPHRLEVKIDVARNDRQDPLWRNIAANARIGLLAIDLETRRRLRINGAVEQSQESQLLVRVQACYPNCPKYIQRRSVSPRWARAESGSIQEGSDLSDAVVGILARADTLFVASAHPQQGADVSHRGGRPGFVQVIGENAIQIPDYAGNNLFNTLGNFHVYPHAGLLVPDFASGRLLQLIGRPAIEWSREPVGQGAGATNRCWTLRIARWRITTPPAYLEHRFIDYFPYLPGDGTTTSPKPDREDPMRP